MLESSLRGLWEYAFVVRRNGDARWLSLSISIPSQFQWNLQPISVSFSTNSRKSDSYPRGRNPFSADSHNCCWNFTRLRNWKPEKMISLSVFNFRRKLNHCENRIPWKLARTDMSFDFAFWLLIVIAGSFVLDVDDAAGCVLYGRILWILDSSIRGE